MSFLRWLRCMTFCRSRVGRYFNDAFCEKHWVRPVRLMKPKTYITVNRGVIDRNRKRGLNDPPIRVSRGKYGKVRYGHAAIVFGPCTFKYDPKHPLPHGARLWVETRSTVGVRR